MEFVEVASLEELRESKRKKIEIEGQSILLIYRGGEVFAINSVCPHAGGPLEEGEINQDDISCPWHFYTFNIRDGSCLNSPSCRIRKYNIKLEGEKVLIKI
ncbi:Rieske (2Fe-2S) protein [Candidatus Woesearchaeota archaeon]|nr:Rieske (2Fe-2S) protein [Candidatus Woesearchaeota archaeon]